MFMFVGMKKYQLVFVLLVVSILAPIHLHASALSPEAQISLLTASPGTELYSVFGHSALRVIDPITGIDEVYNYGTFDFDTPNFYVKFTRGQLLYQLTVTTTQQFLWEYEYEQRAMYEQVLVLDPEEKQRIYDFLLINRLPENKEYLYDFFYDNCATRIRDLVDELLLVDWGEDPYPAGTRTFRQMLQPYLTHMHWPRFGIDIALGLPADQIATPWHYMFLPDEMFVAFAQARHTDGRPLTKPASIMLHELPAEAPMVIITPGRVMWLLFLIAVLSLFNKRFSFWYDKLFFSLLGLAGLLILFLWFLSDHQATNQNMNLLWALPTHLYFVFKIQRQLKPNEGGTFVFGSNRLTRYYFLIAALISLLLIAFWPLVPQDFHEAFVPILATVALKGVHIFIRYRV